MVVAQLAERSLLISDIRGSNPPNGKILNRERFTAKKKGREYTHFKKELILNWIPKSCNHDSIPFKYLIRRKKRGWECAHLKKNEILTEYLNLAIIPQFLLTIWWPRSEWEWKKIHAEHMGLVWLWGTFDFGRIVGSSNWPDRIIPTWLIQYRPVVHPIKHFAIVIYYSRVVVLANLQSLRT